MSELLEEHEVYKGPRFSVIKKKYRANNGEEYIRDIVHPGDASLILPIDENDNIIWIKQLREAVDKVQLELPAGIVEPGEEPIDAAYRELEEETGLKAGKMEHLTSIYPSIGYTDECVHVFVAKEFTQGVKHLDDDEEISNIIRISVEECYQKALRCEYNHSNMNVALLLYYLKYHNK